MRGLEDNLYQSIRTWLGAQADNDMNSNHHQRHLLARHSGSGEWLFAHAIFQNWLRSNTKDIQAKLWLKGSPGAGKSFICSAAIDHVTNTSQEICLYYFYRFDDQSGGAGDEAGGRGVRAAALLVDQLFRHFWRQDRGIAAPVGAYIEATERNITTLAEVIRVILKRGLECSNNQEARPATDRTSIYLFLDGLDENKDPQAADEILRLFHGLEDEFPVTRKLWVSSRDTNVLRQRLDPCPVINVDTHAKADVEDFLIRAMPFNSGAEGGRKMDGKPCKTCHSRN